MAYKKYHSPKLDWARDRQSKLKSIKDDYAFSETHKKANGDAVINELQAAQDEYNDLLATIDVKRMELAQKEKKATKYYTGALTKVKSDFGEDSDEYEKAGGTRVSKRKSPLLRRSRNTKKKEEEKA